MKELKFEMDGPNRTTPCPRDPSVMVDSGVCVNCQYFNGYSNPFNTIKCAWEKPMEKDNTVPDGWYYIKLVKDLAFESLLPPTRCIYVESGSWKYRKRYSNLYFPIHPEMIESPAYTIGKEYEFSDHKDKWRKGTYGGYLQKAPYPHYALNDGNYMHCREIQEEVEPTVTLGELLEITIPALYQLLKTEQEKERIKLPEEL